MDNCFYSTKNLIRYCINYHSKLSTLQNAFLFANDYSISVGWITVASLSLNLTVKNSFNFALIFLHNEFISRVSSGGISLEQRRIPSTPLEKWPEYRKKAWKSIILLENHKLTNSPLILNSVLARNLTVKRNLNPFLTV